MKLVGLTGGIASGKSSISGMFAKLGAETIDADLVSRQVCAAGGECIEPIRKEFGDEVIAGDGVLDRAAIRPIVFSDRHKLSALEAIVHPAIYYRISDWINAGRQKGAKVGIIEATLLIESPPPVPLDALIVVVCNETVRLSRVRARDGFSEAHIRQVMKNQSTDEEKIKHADFVIKSDGTLADSEKQVNEIWQKLIEST